MSTVNLLPYDYLLGRERRRTNAMCLGLFAIVIAGVIGASTISDRTARYAEEVNQRVDREYQQAARLITQMQQLETEKTRLHQKALATASLTERVPRSALLAVVTNALPEHGSLLRFELETKRLATDNNPQGGAKKGSKYDQVAKQREAKPLPTNVTLRVTGLATTDVGVASFIAALARNPLMQTVELVYSQERILEKDQPAVREFQVVADIRPDADAIELRRGSAPYEAPAAVPLARAETGGRP